MLSDDRILVKEVESTDDDEIRMGVDSSMEGLHDLELGVRPIAMHNHSVRSGRHDVAPGLTLLVLQNEMGFRWIRSICAFQEADIRMKRPPQVLRQTACKHDLCLLCHPHCNQCSISSNVFHACIGASEG